MKEAVRLLLKGVTQKWHPPLPLPSLTSETPTNASLSLKEHTWSYSPFVKQRNYTQYQPLTNSHNHQNTNPWGHSP